MYIGEIRAKLDAFIRKYYINKLVRGLLVSLTLLLAFFLFLNLTEYYGHFSTPVRGILFWSFWALLLFVVTQWIVKPLLGLYRLGKILSYADAAVIIGNHFSIVQDKLLNLLQLEEMSGPKSDNSLLLASIEQKTNELKPIAFTGAINIKANSKYAKFLALPVLLLGIILVFQSNIITDGAKRIINYNKFYKEKAPFQFLILNKKLEADKGSDFELQLSIEGHSAPEDVYLNFKNQQIKMNKNEHGNFVFLLHNIETSENFHFTASGFESEEYKLLVNLKPSITGAEAIITYPAYTGRAKEFLPNATDFLVPEGSQIEWKFQTRDADRMILQSGTENEIIYSNNNSGGYHFIKKFFKSVVYKVLPQIGNKSSKDTLAYSIKVLPDLAPSINTEKSDDSANLRQFYFMGSAGDDYGISRITFNYRYTQSENAGKMAQKTKSITIPFRGAREAADFYYVLNMDELGMAPSDMVEYYFEAWDNDGINGSKSARTQVQTLRRESLDELRKEAKETSGNVKNMMKQAFKEAKQLQQESSEMQDRLNREKNMNWDDKSRIEDLLKKQNKFQEKLENIKKEQEKLKQQQEEFQGKKEEMKEKQKQMDELFKKLDDPELKKLMEEIQKLLDKKASKEEINEKLEQMQQKNKESNKELDQLMEQFKQLQLEQKLQDNIDQLQKLAEKEQKLSEKTADAKNTENKELKKEQEDLQKQLEKVQEELKEAEKMNKELEKPMDLDMAKPEQEGANEEMKKAEQNLDKDKNKKASENQKSAADQMKKAADKMKDNLEKEEAKRLSEDYQKIRQLLENLVDASFKQEDVFSELSKIREYNPKFVELNRQQMNVKEECLMIEDSLRALAKRQPMVSTFITAEIGKINTNMGYAMESLKGRRVGDAAMREQFVMTGLNNLAVMLMESMENMQQQMSKKKGNGACKNPGGNGKGKSKGDPKSGDKLSKSQETLGKMLQDLQKKAQEQRQGKKPGQKPGEKSGTGAEGKGGDKEMNKDYARMALMQEALRRELNELRKTLEKEGEEGRDAGKKLQKTEELMEQQERDLVNKRITPEMIQRQKEIETRLLEHEKADRNQQMENKRESNQPPKYSSTLPPELQEYMKKKQLEREILRQSPPELNPYYKEKSREYLRTVK